MDNVRIADFTDFNEELRYQYDLKPDDLVLDIGSYRREFTDKIIKLYGCKVECFDALDNKAAWKFDGKIHMGGNYLYTSIYADVVDKEYFCVDIAKYLREKVALVKMNIEGGEYELLTYIIGKGLMKNIKNLQVQFHLVEGLDCLKMYQLLFGKLSETHTQTWGVPFVWENWERC